MTHHTASLIRAQAYLSVMDSTIKRPLNRFIIANAGRYANNVAQQGRCAQSVENRRGGNGPTRLGQWRV